MAITIRHDAASAGTAPSTQTKRLGQQLVLQRQQQVFTDAQRERDRLYDNFRQEAQNKFQLQRDAQARIADRERQQLGFEQQRNMQQDRIAAENQMLADRNKAEQQQWVDRREIERKDAQAQAGQVRRDQDISSLKAGITQADLTPEGKQKAGELLGNLKAIEAQRDNLRPDQYNGLIDKWKQDYQSSGLDQYVKPAPQMDTLLGEQFRDLGTGMGVFRQPDGKWQVLEIDPSKTNPAKTNGAGLISQVPAGVPFEQIMQNPQLDPKVKQNLYNQGKKYAEAKIQQNSSEGDTHRAPTDEEVLEGMKQAHGEQEQQSRIMGTFQPAPQTPQAQPQPAQAQPQAQQPIPRQSSDTVSQTPIQAVQPQPTVAPQPAAPAVQTTGATPSVGDLQNTLSEAQKMSPEQRIATLMPIVKLGTPQDDYTSLSQWMSDADMQDGFGMAVKAGQYQSGQYRDYVIKQVDDMMTGGLTDRIIGMKAKQNNKTIAAKVVPALQQTAPQANTEEEAASLLENDFIAPDGTHRYKPR